MTMLPLNQLPQGHRPVFLYKAEDIDIKRAREIMTLAMSVAVSSEQSEKYVASQLAQYRMEDRKGLGEPIWDARNSEEPQFDRQGNRIIPDPPGEFPLQDLSQPNAQDIQGKENPGTQS